MPRVAGYSGTPLAKKLGIGAGSKVCVAHAPPEYLTWLEPLPEPVMFVAKVDGTVDVVHVFATKLDELSSHLNNLRSRIRPDAAVWVSWPKKASKVATDITEDRIRAVALPMGYVDVKVCAVSDVWSGLKLVVRKGLR